jgi:hypothetical protein
MSTARKILTALAAGVAIGVVTGFHLARQEGTSQPENDMNEDKNFADNLKDHFKKGKDRLKDIEDAILEVITDSTTRAV